MEIILILLLYLFGAFLVWAIFFSLYASYRIGIKQKRDSAIRMYEFYQKEYDETVEARKAQGQKEPNEEELSLLWNLEAYKKEVEEPSWLDKYAPFIH